MGQGRNLNQWLQNKPIPVSEPLFRFHPNAFADEAVFVPFKGMCASCAKPAKHRYQGVIYVAAEYRDLVICPECIAAGCLTSLFGTADYALHDCEFSEDCDPTLSEEVMRCTPGFATFNPFIWPVIDGVPLAFIGYSDDLDPEAQPEVFAAMQVEHARYSYDPLTGASPYFLIFQEVGGGKYVASLDLD